MKDCALPAEGRGIIAGFQIGRPFNREQGLHAAQFAFPRDALMRLVHAFYPVFQFTTALGQFLCDFIRAAWDIATDCGDELYELTDVKFVGQHGTLQHKARSNVPWKNAG
jgi:hypothetical protein